MHVPSDVRVAPGISLDILVHISDVIGRDVYSVGISLETDLSIITPIDVFIVSTIAAHWATPTFNSIGGQIQIAMAGTSPLDGSGPVVCDLRG